MESNEFVPSMPDLREAGPRSRLNHGTVDRYDLAPPPQQLATTTAKETPRYFNRDATLFKQRRRR